MGEPTFPVWNWIDSQDSIKNLRKEFALLGHDAEDMLNTINRLTLNPSTKVDTFIISGGVRNILHAWRLHNLCRGKSVIGRANAYLQRAAISYEVLAEFIREEIEQWAFAKNFVHIN